MQTYLDFREKCDSDSFVVPSACSKAQMKRDAQALTVAEVMAKHGRIGLTF